MKTQSQSSLPIVVYCILLFAVSFVSWSEYRIPTWSNGLPGLAGETLNSICIGLLVGLLSLAIIVGGCWGRSWLHGLLFVSVFAILLDLCTGLDLYRTLGKFRASPTTKPVELMVCCLPFFAMRHFFGWTLCTAHETTVQKTRFRVEDLFTFSVIVAACNIFIFFDELLNPLHQQQHISIASQSLKMSMLPIGMSLLIIPSTLIAFRVKNRHRRWVVLTILFLTAWIAVQPFGFVVPSQNRLEFAWNSFLVVFFGSSTVLSGYWILLHHGFKLTRYPTNLESRTGIVTSKISTPETKMVRRQVRWITVVFFLSALACSAAISWDAEQKHLTIEKRIRLERHFWLLCDEIEKQGDSVRIYDDSVKELFVNNATDSEILKYLKFSDLEHLSLTKSNVTDAVIDSLYVFPKLRSLDISDTKITVEGLRRLPNGINSLSIARMQISLEELREVLASRSFVKLDLRGIGINDSDLISLIDSGEIYQSGYLSTLVLSDNPITDAGITRLLNGRRRYRFLDLSGTQVDGTGIPAFRVPRRLVLDRTKISDASLPPLLLLGTTLSLKSTSVSISSLSSAEPNVSIALQDCRISEKDLASAGPLQFDTLSLNGKEYTGACFAGSNITAASLDMSHSGLTDACAHYLTKVLGVARLRLSDTSVSDVSLLSVAKLALTELDIRQTAISAKGLLAANFDSKTKVIVGRTQFYYADLERLKQKFDVIVDMDTGW